MKCNIFIGMIFFILSNAVLADGLSLNPFMILKETDSTRYATKMSDGIQNRPECQKFKDKIMSHSKGSPYEGKTVMAISATREKAKIADCAK